MFGVIAIFAWVPIADVVPHFAGGEEEEEG
jgi:hypothetical protein